MAIKPPKPKTSTSQVQLPLRPKNLKKGKKPEHASAQADAFRRLVDRVWWAKGLRILVIGCGEGEETVGLHERLRADFTVGIDTEPNAIHVASARQQQTLRFLVADPISWEPNDRFNLIFIHPTTSNTETLSALLQRARSLLEEEGQLIVYVPHAFDHDITVQFWEWCLDSEYSALFAQTELANSIKALELSDRLHSLGFRAQQVDVQVLPQHLNDHHDLLQWLLKNRLPPVKSGIDSAITTAFQSEAIQQLAQICEERPHLYWPTAHLLAWARLP